MTNPVPNTPVKRSSPFGKVAVGVGLAMGIFPISGMGVLVGLAMYLPFYITGPGETDILFGAVAVSLVGQYRIGRSWPHLRR